MRKPLDDGRLVYRYLDGEMTAEELERFRVRIEREPDLRSALKDAEELRSWFRPGRAEPGFAAAAGFSERVLAEVRRLPSREDLIRAGALDPAEERQLIGLSHRLLAAAVVLAGLFAALASGLFFPPETDRLEASPDEIRTEMDRLDALIRDEGAGGRPEESGGR